jgi:hypothetical protein
VLAAAGHVPPDLVDARLGECASLAPAVRAAGSALLQELRASGTRIVSQTVELDDAGASVQILERSICAAARNLSAMGRRSGSPSTR